MKAKRTSQDTRSAASHAAASPARESCSCEGPGADGPTVEASTAALAASGSPAAIAQRRFVERVYNSPRGTAQRRKLESLGSNPAAHDESALQKRSSPAPNRTGLPDQLKNGIESLSGLSLDNVHVHYNSSRPAQLNAHAFAQGSSIHLAPGQERHLPHEAWHVVQQSQGRVRPTTQAAGNVPVNDEPALEREADAMGSRALQMKAVGAPSSQAMEPSPSAAPVQRTLEGHRDGARVADLKQQMIDAEMMRASPSSARYQKFLSMIAEDTRYSEEDILAAVGDMPQDEAAEDEGTGDDDEAGFEDGSGHGLEDEDALYFEEDEKAGKEPADASDFELDQDLAADIMDRFAAAKTVATIIWTGGNLGPAFIMRFRATLEGIPDADELSSEDLAKRLHDTTVHAVDPAEHELLKGMAPLDEIRQHLDQEEEFAVNVSLVQKKLEALGATVHVFRPHDAGLLRPRAPTVNPGWIPIANASQAAFAGDGKEKRILVTMGHGARGGQTSFNADGMLSQEDIGRILRIPADIGAALLYIPLQCYPLRAVQQARGVNWTSGSVESNETISSSDIRLWVNRQMDRVIHQWIR